MYLFLFGFVFLNNKIVKSSIKINKFVRNICLSMCDVSVFDVCFAGYGTALTAVLPVLFLYLDTVIATAGAFEP